MAELQSTVIAMRGEIDALRGQVESLASQVVALTEDVLDTRAHTKNLLAVRAPQASGCAFRRSRPLIPIHRDHPLRSIATSVDGDKSAVRFIC